MSMNIRIALSVIAPVAALLGCAGSPVHTSKLSPEELREVSDYTVCHGAASTMHFKPHSNVLNEVKRRQLDCSLIYTTPQPRRSKLDKTIHSMKLDNKWVWCKDSPGCVSAVNWMKQNSRQGKDSKMIKNYQLTLEKAINFHNGRMVSIIGSGITKTQKPYKLELQDGAFNAKELTAEQADGFGLNRNAILNKMPDPSQAQ